jgi:hypothetical protein
MERIDAPRDGAGRTRADIAPTLVELIAPVAGVGNCTMEVETPEGVKLRLELKAVAMAELAHLIRAFVGR